MSKHKPNNQLKGNPINARETDVLIERENIPLSVSGTNVTISEREF